MKKKTKIVLYVASIVICVGGIIFLINSNLNSVLTSVLSSLIGSAITFCLGRIIAVSKMRKSQFTGYYRDEIFSKEDPEKIIKRDRFHIQEISNGILGGKIVRYYPKKDNLSHWQCSGYIVMDQILFVYRAEKDTTPSRGVVIVRHDTSREEGMTPRYTVMYYKYEGESIISHRINIVKISEKEYNSLLA